MISEYLLNHSIGPHLMTTWPIKSLYVARASTLPVHFFSSYSSSYLMLLLPSLLLSYTYTYICLTLSSFFFFFFFFLSTPFPSFFCLHFASFLQVIGVSKSDSFMTFVLYTHIYLSHRLFSSSFLVHTISFLSFVFTLLLFSR